MARTSPAPAPPEPAAGRIHPASGRPLTAIVLACYLVGAVAVTARLWADPASRFVAGNSPDADLFAWFMRYAATAVSHGRVPDLLTTAMNAPRGVNLMWNTPVLLPAMLLTPVTLLFGPQVSLTVMMTAGFAGSAAAMFWVLRRWGISTSAAALAGAVYGFSPALLQSAIGHYSVQFAVLPPLLVDAGLRLCAGSDAPVRDGIRLGLLAAAQLFIAEELLFSTALAGLLIAAMLTAGQPRLALQRLRGAAAGLTVAAGVILALAGAALWVQFTGPLAQHGSPFTLDYYKSDLTGFVVPSQYLLFHTPASAAEATRFQGLAPEYLGYLGWPLIILLAAAAVTFWRHPVIRALAVVVGLYELLSLGAHPLIGGTLHAGVTLPWHWFEGKPLIGDALPDRLSIIADGAAAALLALSADLARSRLASWRVPSGTLSLGRAWPARSAGTQPATGPAATLMAGPAGPRPIPAGNGQHAAASGQRRLLRPGLVLAAAVAAALPLLPLPLPPAQAARLPAGWPRAFSSLHLAPDARVLVVPVPTSLLTVTMRWQGDTGQPAHLIGGYFVGPGPGGQAYMEGTGVTATAQYLNQLWYGGPPPGQSSLVSPPDAAQLRADLGYWRPAAVVAVTTPGSPLARYLIRLFRQPDYQQGQILAWRL
ncbi:MAG TPA: hypothetical protein VGI64_21705 [Streptosporangiaceae bacterium]